MDLSASQPICTGTSEQPTSQVHPQELVGPDTPGVPLSKMRQDLENDPSISRYLFIFRYIAYSQYKRC